MNNLMRPWILMTGVSRGLGRSLAIQLRRAQFQICALVRQQSSHLCADVADECLEWDCLLPWSQNPSEKLITFAQKNAPWGLIHCAGVLGPMDKTPEPLESEAWQRWWNEYHATFQVNCFSGAELAHAVIPFLQPLRFEEQLARPPFIAHLSSGAAVRPYVGWNAYCASKAALWMEFQCLSQRFDPDALLCLSVAPGTVMTDMMKKVLSARSEDFPALSKFKELEKTGGLVDPEVAAKKISDWLTLSSRDELSRWHGEIYDVRKSS